MTRSVTLASMQPSATWCFAFKSPRAQTAFTGFPSEYASVWYRFLEFRKHPSATSVQPASNQCPIGVQPVCNQCATSVQPVSDRDAMHTERERKQKQGGRTDGLGQRIHLQAQTPSGTLHAMACVATLDRQYVCPKRTLKMLCAIPWNYEQPSNKIIIKRNKCLRYTTKESPHKRIGFCAHWCRHTASTFEKKSEHSKSGLRVGRSQNWRTLSTHLTHNIPTLDGFYVRRTRRPTGHRWLCLRTP
jgi:hypothetical protein